MPLYPFLDLVGVETSGASVYVGCPAPNLLLAVYHNDTCWAGGEISGAPKPALGGHAIDGAVNIFRHPDHSATDASADNA